MSNFNIENLISLLEKGEISKDELLSAMNQIQFQPVSLGAAENDGKLDEDPNGHLTENDVLQANPETNPSPNKDLEENIQNLEKDFEPILPEVNDKVDDEAAEDLSNELNVQSELPLRIDEMRVHETSKGELPFARPEPSISEKAQETERSCKPASSPAQVGSAQKGPGFLVRIGNYQHQKESKRRERESQLRELETKECSFQPKINKGSVSPPRSAQEIGERLYRQTRKAEIVEQLRLEQEEREAAEILENCTFKPFVYSKGAKPKYMEAANEICSLKSMSVTCRSCLADEGLQCTFRPETNKVSKAMRQAKEYLSLDPYTRLSQSTNKAQRMLELYEDYGDKEIFTQSQIQNAGDSKERLAEFYNRQYAFEMRKQENKQKLLNEMMVDPTPKINKKSEEIVKGLVDFDERNEVLLNRNENHVIKQGEEFQKEYTFQPQILPVSKNMKSKNFVEMSYAPVVQKEMKIDKIKKTIAQKEAQSCTFKPELKAKKYVEVPSKLQLKNNIETYMERIQLEKQRQENFSKMYKQKRNYEEIAECTHTPKINDLPYYMKIKKEVEMRSSQGFISRKDQKGSYTRTNNSKLQ